MSHVELTVSEKIVALKTLEGETSEEIADFLGVTKKHVDNVIRRLRRLMQSNDPRVAARKAKDQGLLKGI